MTHSALTFLVPEYDESWGGDAIPHEAADIADEEGEYGYTNHGEEGSGPFPVVAASPQSLKGLPYGPDSGLGQVCSAFVEIRTWSHILAVTTSRSNCSLASIWNPDTVLRATDPLRCRCRRRYP